MSALTPVASRPGEESVDRTRDADLSAHLEGLRRFWKSAALITLIGLLLGIGSAAITQQQWETRTTFFVATQTSSGTTPLQADEFAQRRINSYVGVIDSDRLAQLVIDKTGLPLTTADVTRMVSAAADPDTVLMTVTVRAGSSDNSLLISRAIAENLDGLIGQLDSRASGSAVQLSVLSGPTLNPAPVAPRWKLNIALGLLIGAAVGVAQALIRQRMDTSYRSREQLASGTGLPLLGAIGFEPTAKKRGAVLQPSETHSARADTTRQLRTNLRYVDADSAVEVLAVTSSVDGEGKSTTAVNLAQVFAASGRRTLLVDANLRKPRLADYLGLSNALGLSSVLIGEAGLAEAVQTWGPSGLDVVVSGPVPPNPSELLGSVAMEQFLAAGRSAYELVIVDTPPLLPVTDAAVTAASADGVIVVVRHGKTDRDDVQGALEALSAVDARVLGTVFSMVPASRSDRLPAYGAKPKG